VTFYREAPWEWVLSNWRGDASHEHSSVEIEVAGCMALIHDSFKSMIQHTAYIHIKKGRRFRYSDTAYGILTPGPCHKSHHPEWFIWYFIDGRSATVCARGARFSKFYSSFSIQKKNHHVCRTWTGNPLMFISSKRSPKHTHLLLVGAEEAQVRAEWVKMLAGNTQLFEAIWKRDS